jgi:hypothetical protein
VNKDCVNCDKGECCEEWKRAKFWNHLIWVDEDNALMCWRPIGCALVWLEKESTDEHT